MSMLPGSLGEDPRSGEVLGTYPQHNRLCSLPREVTHVPSDRSGKGDQTFVVMWRSSKSVE